MPSRFGLVLRDTAAVRVQHADSVLRLRIASLGARYGAGLLGAIRVLSPASGLFG